MIYYTSSNRYEIKYLLKYNHSALTKKNFSGLLIPSLPHTYYIQTIYFDSSQYIFYREKIEGLAHRVKPRLRIYRDAPDGPILNVFLELKYRHNLSIHKERVEITPRLAILFLNGNYDSCFEEIQKNRSPVFSKFYYLATKLALKPSLNVVYYRQAFQSEVYPHIRFTYDTQVQASFTCYDLNIYSNSLTFVLDPRDTILEIKYNKKLPRIILNYIALFEIKQLSLSKYAICLGQKFKSIYDKTPVVFPHF